MKVEELKAQQLAASTPNRGQGSSATGNAIVDFAYRLIGTQYVYGATGPNAFDCSGFTSYVYRHAAGVEITRTTWSQYSKGRQFHIVNYNQEI